VLASPQAGLFEYAERSGRCQ